MPRKAAAKEEPKKAAPKKRGPRAYKLPESIPAGEILKDLYKKEWKLGPTVGKGGFGELYLADEATTGSVGSDAKYVVKIEPRDNGPLFVEQAFYQRGAKPDLVEEWKQKHKLSHLGVPKFIGSGMHTRGKKDFRFLVMERFGEDIWKKYLASNKQFTPKTAFTLSIQILDSLEYLHSTGYAHADIKSANILLGFEAKDQNKVFLVDYGLASRFSINGEHREYKADPKKAHDGTPEFTSRDAHNGVTPSRRGDMEILGYVILQWLTGCLPWEHKISLNNTDFTYLTNEKTKFMSNVTSLMKACFPKGGHPAELQKYMEYVSKLEYEQVPNYKQMKELFTKAITRSGGRADGKLDFVSPVVVNKTANKRKNDSDEADSPQKVAKRGRGRKAALSSSSSNSDSPRAKSPKAKPVAASRKPVTKTTGRSTERSPGRSTPRSPGRSPSAKTASGAAKKGPAAKRGPAPKPKVQPYATKKSPVRSKVVKSKAETTPSPATGETFTKRKRKFPVSVATSSTQTSPGVKQTPKIKRKR
ncbi:serine/threonine-protein kinase VRK1-like isoform X1 [Asterias rubens]|uniref:serine/threonine-protein kinase VRK1-like isoform X1 n=1 Tax=Asterias rubens TaxID=7604 RepID=UPI0014559A1C|nr:serine/threonine-protein kinase VRK1-like isoform X1 [Asterias rubens]XP_033634998.1 serine/threonine-protein kinase VRK1-like isoform X1 [Asterias rubens]XP_033635005.1 serine/threonine-protein kinase VRK1-like isoform X1 [Asterias rubens]